MVESLEPLGDTVRDRVSPTRRHRLRPTLVIVVALVVLTTIVVPGLQPAVWGWVGDVLGWTRDERNAASVQAISAAGQVVLAAVLIVLTWWATRTAQRVADESREQAREASRPLVTFRIPDSPHHSIDYIKVKMINDGAGPALNVAARVAEGPVRYSVSSEGMTTILRPGMHMTFELRRQAGTGAVRGVPASEWLDLTILIAEYGDLHGRKMWTRSVLAWNERLAKPFARTADYGWSS